MAIRHPSLCLLLVAGLLCLPLAAQATLISRLGGQAYYDTVLDITWLADANLAASNTFGLTQIAYVFPDYGQVGSSGRMTGHTANAWIAGMNTANYLGFDDWRLPSLSPVSGRTSFNIVSSNNGTTDQGYGATGVGWETLTGDIVSEMGWMYYGNLGNLGYCMPNDANPDRCNHSQTGFGLSNTGPFSNLQSGSYWSGQIDTRDGSDAWYFRFDHGAQGNDHPDTTMFAWAVRSGDVGAAAPVPEPGTMLLLGAGLLGLVGGRWRARRRVSDRDSAL